MKRVPVLVGLGLLASGCVTRSEYVRHDAEMRKMLMDTQARLSQVQRELDRLRGDVDSGGRGPAADAARERIASLEERLRQAEAGGRAATLGDPRDAVEPPPSDTTAAGATTTANPTTNATSPTTTIVALATTTTTVPPPARSEVPEDWAREVAQEQAVAGAMNVPEKSEFLGIMDGVAKRDCSKSIDQLNGFVAKHKESALAGNALYWAARCYLVRGEQNQAISKFYEVGTKYPKGSRTPAALLAQANLFLSMGNTPDARIVLSRLTSYYPNSEEAASARKKLAELQH